MNKKLAPLRAKNDVTHAIQLKLHERMNKVAVTSYGRNKNHDNEIKNIAGQVLTYNSKNFHWLNNKRLITDYEWIGKTISKKNQIKNFKKKTKNWCQNAACEQDTTSQKWKFGSHKKLGLEWAINGLGKPFRENPI